LLLAGPAVLAGCDSDPKPSATASLTNNDAIHKAMKNLVDTFQNLDGDIGDFATDDWKDVVPQVRDGAVEVGDAIQQMKTALGYS
jgi:hypothetical protein